MSWPRNTDYNEAIQNLRSTVSDEELRDGQPVLNPLGIPSPYSGNFADVYKINCPKTGNTWAVKCFTREVHGLRDRYREISAHLNRTKLGFMVDFQYVEPGIRAAGGWYPLLKMRWVEGLNLNQFVSDYLDRRKMLKQLLGLWVKLSERLREAEVAHADLQHGNVLLVPASNRGHLGLKLIDYDGMYVPALAGKRSGESGHPAYQHPQRSREKIFGAEVDRFSHLAIYTAIHCLILEGRPLWQGFNNYDNLLFGEADFLDPGNSRIFRTLWCLKDSNAHALVGRLIISCRGALDEVPLLGEMVDREVLPLRREEERQANAVMDGAVRPVPPMVPVSLPEAHTLPPRLPASASEAARCDVAETPWWSASQQADPASTVPAPTTSPASATQPEPSASQWTALWERLQPLRESPALVCSYAALAVTACVAAAVVLFVMRGDRPLHYQRPDIQSDPDGRKQGDSPPNLPGPKPGSRSLNVQSKETNSIGMKLTLIPPGEFTMGSPDSEGDSDERPQHRARITNPFWLGIHEVTVGQYRRFADEMKPTNMEWQNASGQQTDDHPVVNVSWEDANAFLNWLSAKEGTAYRLPSEAEWEYACRAGTTTKYSFGDDEKSLDDHAWYSGNSGSTPHPVGRKKPNAWGLYDMHGNVWEWCQDWYESGYYSQSPTSDPIGPSSTIFRVLRGGSWPFTAPLARSANRDWGNPRDRGSGRVGFRAAKTVPQDTNGATSTRGMGAPESERESDEQPQHGVRITKP